MPKQGQRAEVNTFIQGLITEASPLNFPPNASKDEVNFVLNRDGTRNRRLGMDLSSEFTSYPTEANLVNINTIGTGYFKWAAPGGVQDMEILVIHVGSRVYFYNLTLDVLVGNAAYMGMITGIPSLPSFVNYSFASVDGKLIITSGLDVITIVSFDPISESFSTKAEPLMVRDFWGIEVPGSQYETDKQYRGGYVPQHNYNLQNQSWGIPRKNQAGVVEDPSKTYNDGLLLYPSDTEVVWTGLQFQPIVGVADPFERVYTNLYQERLGANLSAPKGYFIINVLARGAGRRAAYVDNQARSGNKMIPLDPDDLMLPLDITLGGPAIVTDYAGRAFYAGFPGEVTSGDSRSPNLSNFVLFSQLIKNGNDITKCYQEGDPTSRDASDVVDTDGGFLRISGVKRIVSLAKLGQNLIILADNGIWAVSGGSDFGFTATNYKVTKISTYGVIASGSVVSQGSSVLYWGEGGIYAVTLDKYAQLVVNSLTQTTIQQYYDTFSLVAKSRARGVYDDVDKKIRWVTKEGDPFVSIERVTELVFDTTLNCFSKNNISLNTALNQGRHECMFPVFANKTFYVTFLSTFLGFINFAFSTYSNAMFQDWGYASGGGVDAKAYLLTGSQIAGDSAIEKQTPYVVMHFKRTETTADTNGVPLNQSSCMFRTNWDWAINSNSNKLSDLQQAYRYRIPYFNNPYVDNQYDNGFEIVTTRNKVRGRGRAFGLYFETEPGKDCHITGWNLTLNGNAIA